MRLQVEALEARWVPSYIITGIASFAKNDPAGSLANVVEDSSGNLFGTTAGGGANNLGKLFEWVKSTGTTVTLASFNGDNGAAPTGDLVIDSSGNLFGTTESGLANGATLFEWVKSSGTISVLHYFTNADSAHGTTPVGGLVVDSSGNLFGTTSSGGINSEGGLGNDGTVFEWVKSSGMFSTLASFHGTNGSDPRNTLLEDSSGNLFGTTPGGGAHGDGTIFEWNHSTGALSALWSFNGSDGRGPQSGLVEDSSGNLFGTTYGGTGSANANGTVFEWVKSTGNLSPLDSFNGSNGSSPTGDLVLDSSGNLFGTTSGGGQGGGGTVFEWVKSTGKIAALASFANEGHNPNAGLVQDTNGNLLGTNENADGGVNNPGLVFAVVKSTTWTGLGANNNWSTPGNWTDGVPGTGQAAVFSTHAGSSTAVVDAPFYGVLRIDNNWGGTITVNQPLTTWGTDRWASGTMTVASGVTWTNTSTLTLGGNQSSTNLSLSGPGTLSNTNFLSVGQSTTLTDSGEYTETGTLFVVGGATAKLSGTFDNYDGAGTLTGGTYDIQGTFQFPNAAIATNAANLILDGSRAAVADQNGTDALGPNLAVNAAGASLTFRALANFTTAGDFENDGTLTVSDGSTFTVSGNYTDTGTLSVLAAGTVTLGGGGTASGTVKVGATLIVAAGSTFTDSGSYREVAGSNNVPSTLQVQSGATAILSGTFNGFSAGTLIGTYDILGTLQFANAAIVTDAANLILDGSSAAVTDLTGTDALGPNLTTITAQLTVQNGATFTSPGNFTLAGTLNVGSSSSTFTSDGNLTVSRGATLTLQNTGTVTTTGDFNVQSNVTIPSGATIGVGGNLTVASGVTLTVQAGGSLSTTADFNNSGSAVIAAGVTVNVGGNYTQAAAASLDLQLGGAAAGQYAVLAVTGQANLNGTLKATLVNGYVPQSGDTLPVLTYATRSGAFATGPAGFTLNYDDTDGILDLVKL